MRIGLSYDLKGNQPLPAGAPDDLFEEFDSPVTVHALADVFRGLGHQVVELGDGRGLVESLLARPPDLVFNFAEGTGVGRSRESRVPAVCELLEVPYTGSDPGTLALALDKDWTRRLVSSAGIPVPRGCLVTHPDAAASTVTEAAVPFPVIVKPNWEGSSKGVRGKSLVETPDRLGAVVAEFRHAYQQPLLVEEFIDGPELTVGLIGPTEQSSVLGTMLIRPRVESGPFVYDIDVKRDFRRQVIYECPPPLPEATRLLVERHARTAYQLLGCRDFARLDFRLRDGVPYFLEVNPLPGLNPESSDLVIMAGLLNVSYPDLVGSILDAALRRLRLA